MITSLWVLVLLGLVVGFCAGLLGIGGGALMVPALAAYFLWHGQDAALVVHMALATSLSCIIFNALLSIKTHQQHGAIIWPLVLKLSPTVLLGSALASFFVVQIPSRTIALVFMVLMLLVAIQLMFDIKPRSTSERGLKTPTLIMTGGVIGFVSAMLAIGGGSLTVPYLTAHRINIKNAIATAAAVGLPIALAGTLVFLLQTPEQQPAHTFGYVYWPATVALCLGSAATTPLGAHMTHRLPVAWLKKIFALLIMLLAWRMYVSVN